MLVLSRYRDESIIIGDNIIVKVVEIQGNKVRLGVDAPTDIPVHRQEVHESIAKENLRKTTEAIERDAEKARTAPYPRIASPPSLYAPETD